VDSAKEGLEGEEAGIETKTEAAVEVAE